MRAELSQDAKLTVTPETGAEAYALRKWAADFFGQHEWQQGEACLAIQHDIQPEATPND